MKDIVKVVDNNQEHWKVVCETEPNVTLGIGTELLVLPTEKPADVFEVKTMQDVGDVICCNGVPMKFDEVVDRLNLLALQRKDFLRRLRHIQQWAT